MNNITQEALLQTYLDGACTPEEQAWVEQAIATNPAVRAEWQLLLSTHQLLQQNEVLAPGMRFSQNVMEAIAALPVAKKPGPYLHPLVVYGLLGTPALILLVLVGYAVVQQGSTGLLQGNTINRWLPTDKLEQLSLPQNYYSVVIFTITLLLLLLIERWLRVLQPTAKRGR
jgi:anti-sigma factor RsiW